MASLMQEPHVAPVGLEALDLVAALHERCFPADTGEIWRRRDLQEMMRLPNVLCLVAAVEETPLGYALARFAADECELLSLGVLEEARRQGIARHLVAELRRRCRDRGMTRMFLEVREDNWPARSFYGRLGFHEIGTRRNYYRGKGGVTKDAVTMAVDVDS